MNEVRKIRLPILYLPPVSWFSYAIKAEEIFLGSDIPYRKQTLRNRAGIMTANGKMTLSIPVSKPGLRTAFGEVRTDPGRAWQRLHWRAIHTAYAKSPFFEFYRDVIASYYAENKTVRLREFNLGLILDVCRLLQADIRFSSQAAHEGIVDLAPGFLTKPSPARMPPGQFPEYRQVFAEKHPFSPNLSILDLLFNLGPESGAYLKDILP